MKPTKPGFYKYFNGNIWEPVKVWTHEWSGKVIVCFEQIGKLGVRSVSSTEDSDWGPEIKGDVDDEEHVELDEYGFPYTKEQM